MSGLRETYLDEKADLEWLFDTHLKAYRWGLPRKAGTVIEYVHYHILAAVIVGNEDCPQEIKVWKKIPNVKDKPYAHFYLQEDGSYAITKPT